MTSEARELPNPDILVREEESGGAWSVGGRRAKVRAMAAARARGAVGSLCRYDLGPAVALEVPLGA